jgi:HEAT repeat protein
MPVSMSEVLAELDRDEPDYSRAAQLGPEALPHLRQVVEADNPLRAAKAAYLASLIPGNDSTRLLEQAADHADPSVRVAAAHGLGKTGATLLPRSSSGSLTITIQAYASQRFVRLRRLV